MERIHDISVAQWIKDKILAEQIHGDSQDEAKLIVANVIPPIFASYVKLFHPIYEDMSIQNKTISWHAYKPDAKVSTNPWLHSPTYLLKGFWHKKLLESFASFEFLKIFHHIFKSVLHKNKSKTPLPEYLQFIVDNSTLERGFPDKPFIGRQVLWKTLAARYGLSFTPTIASHSFTRIFPDKSWPRRLVGPEEGSLDQKTSEALAAALQRHIDDGQDCLFLYDGGAVTWKEAMLFQGRLIEIGTFFGVVEKIRTSPTYWFPSDKSWCVYTDWDLSFTLIGGTEELTKDLLHSDSLECVLISSETRIDYRSDMENLPRPQLLDAEK